jgi:hypothetical protein
MLMVFLLTSQEVNAEHTIIDGIKFHSEDCQGTCVPYTGVVDGCDGETSKFNEATFEVPDNVVAQPWCDLDIGMFLLSMV